MPVGTKIDRPRKRPSTLIAILGIVALIAVLAGAVSWRLAEVSKVSSWTHLVETSPEVIAASEESVTHAQTIAEEAQDESFTGQELIDLEDLVDETVALIAELARLDDYVTVNKIANNESPLAVLDPYSDDSGLPSDEVVIEQPEDYRALLTEFTAVRYELEETTARLDSASELLGEALEHKLDLEKKQNEWLKARRVLADTIRTMSEELPGLNEIVPATWHETTRNFETTLGEAAKLLEEAGEAPKNIPQLEKEALLFQSFTSTLQEQFEAVNQAATAELEALVRAAEQDATGEVTNQNGYVPVAPSAPSTTPTPSQPVSPPTPTDPPAPEPPVLPPPDPGPEEPGEGA